MKIFCEMKISKWETIGLYFLFLYNALAFIYVQNMRVTFKCCEMHEAG